jgi:hypothetical protein
VVSVRRNTLVAAGGLALLVIAIVLVLVLRGGSSQAVPRRAVSAEGLLSESGALFADPLRATIEVLVDRTHVDPARVGFDASFDPYQRIGIPRLTRADAGRLTRLVYTTELVCSTANCLPPRGGKRVQFTPAEVFYFPRDGSARRSVKVSWQPLTLAGRTTNADLNGSDPFAQPSWRATTDPAAASYRISPSLLEALLLTLSSLLFIAAALALWKLLRALHARLRLPIPTSLERAVRLVERSEVHDDAPAKRKALELLSRELARSGESQLALVARELAWGEPAPIPSTTQPLTLDVRRLIEQRSNGHAH